MIQMGAMLSSQDFLAPVRISRIVCALRHCTIQAAVVNYAVVRQHGDYAPPHPNSHGQSFMADETMALVSNRDMSTTTTNETTCGIVADVESSRYRNLLCFPQSGNNTRLVDQAVGRADTSAKVRF